MTVSLPFALTPELRRAIEAEQTRRTAKASKPANEREARRFETLTRCAECGHRRASRRGLWKHRQQTGHRIDS